MEYLLLLKSRPSASRTRTLGIPLISPQIIFTLFNKKVVFFHRPLQKSDLINRFSDVSYTCV